MDSRELELQLLRSLVLHVRNVAECDWSESVKGHDERGTRMRYLRESLEEVERFQQLQDDTERAVRARGMMNANR